MNLKKRNNRKTVLVKKLHEDAIIPSYAKPGDAGFDLYAVEDALIPPNGIVAVRTGLAFAVPLGYEIQVRPRSGLSYNTALRVSNAPGTVDAGFRGEVKVLLDNDALPVYQFNPGSESPEWDITEMYDHEVLTVGGTRHFEERPQQVGTILVRKGDRIAQGVLAEVPTAMFEEVDELDETERGAGGFGSTGVGREESK